MEAREKVAKLAELIYDTARCLTRQEAIDCAEAVLKAGYRLISDLPANPFYPATCETEVVAFQAVERYKKSVLELLEGK